MYMRWLMAFLVITSGLALLSCRTQPTGQYTDNTFTEWMPWVQFRQFLDEKDKRDEKNKTFWDRGYWVLAAEGRWKDGQQQYRVKIAEAPKNKAYLWMWYVNQEQQEFDKHIEQFAVEGYTMIYCNSFTRPSGTRLYQTVWHNENPIRKHALRTEPGTH